MPTSYTSLLGLALPVTGELSGTWGDTVNDYITQYLDASVAGAQVISGSQTAVTLSVTNGSSLTQVGSGSTGSAQYGIIRCTGNPASLLTITAPAASKSYLIINATSTSQSVKIVGAGPTTGVTLVSGESAVVAWNGTDFVKVASSTADGVTTFSAGTTGFTPSSATSGAVTLAGTLATTNGGTGLTSFTANGVVYASSSSALTTGSALTYNGSAMSVNSGGNGGGASMAMTVNGTFGGGIQQSYNNNGGSALIPVSGGGLAFYTYTGANGSESYSEQMRLTSTGLGIGTSSPLSKLTVAANMASAGNEQFFITGTANTQQLRIGYNTSNNYGVIQAVLIGTGYRDLVINPDGGNLGLGVTPSAWSLSGLQAFQVKNGALYGYASGEVGVTANCFYDSGASAWKYISSGDFSTRYRQSAGQHQWYTAASGTAGNAISFTQAMTLDASGNLGVITTSPTSFLSNWNGLAVGTTSGSNGIAIVSGTASPGTLAFADGTSGADQYRGYVQYSHSSNSLVFGTDGASRATLDSSGNLSVGGSAARGTTAGAAAIQLFNGTAPVGTLTNGVSLYSSSGDLRFMDAAGNAYQVGFRNIPQSGSAKTTSYTLATTDVGEYIQVGSSGSVVIPDATFATGDVVSVFNNTSGTITITCSITTAYIAGTDSDKATMTLASRGVATILFISSTVCVVSGNVT